MEKNPQPQHVQRIDILAKLQDHAEFIRQIADKEASAAEATGELTSEALEALDALLGIGDTEELATFSGVAFEVDEEDELSDVPSMLIDRAMTFGGAGYYYIDGTPRIFFDLLDETSSPNVAYAAPFEAILRLHVLTDLTEQPNAEEFLSRHTANAKNILSHPDFLAASQEEQEGQLRAAAIGCYEELLTLIDPTNISVECSAFYKHVDDRSDEAFTVSKVDQTDCNFEDRTAATGVAIGIVYLEVIQRQLPLRDKQDTICGGVPCLTIRNDEANVTMFVPIDLIEQIETND